MPRLNNPLLQSHPRTFAANRYVYPVLSRRAGGISIGVNLNPNRLCSFNCVYCQVDRTAPADTEPLDLDKLLSELDRMVELVSSGRIFDGPQFADTPVALRRLNDIAFSGDGEPTLSPDFDEAVQLCADVRRRHVLDDVKLVLITNAATLDHPRVRKALETLDGNNGEIWAKLDAGTEQYYRLVDRSNVPWQRILDNLRTAAITRPIVIQSLFMAIHGQPPSAAELEAYCSRLNEIRAAGGRIKLVQIHTIARRPAEQWVAALSDAEVDRIAELVRQRTGLTVAAFYGAADSKKQP
ncbi:MAG: radical SAM protein [Planctomycetaceae bacterium]|nr:radical SAM protein [Planctomycetaceae bacterium]